MVSVLPESKDSCRSKIIKKGWLNEYWICRTTYAVSIDVYSISLHPFLILLLDGSFIEWLCISVYMYICNCIYISKYKSLYKKFQGTINPTACQLKFYIDSSMIRHHSTFLFGRRVRSRCRAKMEKQSVPTSHVAWWPKRIAPEKFQKHASTGFFDFERGSP